MTLTYYERGQLQERLEATLLLLEARFGTLSAAVKERVEAMSPAELRQLQVALVRAQTLKELGLDS
jgi:hypothetical protein